MQDKITNFLDEVLEQVACPYAHPSIRRELKEHLTDRIEEYESQGMAPDEAVQKAVSAMGDPASIGARLNEVHRLQKAPLLTGLTALLLLIGFAFTCWMQWSPEQVANGFLYYIPGVVLLVFAAWKACPLVISHWKKLLVLSGLLYLAQFALSVSARYGGRFPLGIHTTGYFALLLLAPVLTLLAYRFRSHGTQALFSVLGIAGVFLFFQLWLVSGRPTAVLILLFAIAGTLFFMIRKDLFSIPGSQKQIQYGILFTGLCLSMVLLFAPASMRQLAKEFLRSEACVHDTWDDTYNGVLIRELLSRTPLTRGISLTQEELMDYGSGTWYFADRDPLQIGLNAIHQTEEESANFWSAYEERRAAGGNPRFLHFDKSNVTLWDVLPQHYHNNYVIAVCMLLYGRLAGYGLLALLAGFYAALFHCIGRLRSRFAASLACCCGLILLAEGILYTLGNFGYQFGSFPNLPLVSEGRVSILFHMLLLGFILSAFRYDQVLEEPPAAGRCPQLPRSAA